MIQKVGEVTKVKNRLKRRQIQKRRNKSPFLRLLEKRLREVRRQSEV